MAISSRMSAPNDWTAQFYHQNFPAQTPGPLGQPGPEASVVTQRIPDSTVITTAVASGTTSVSVGPSSGHLTPEGGVSKPSRRRSRASRRTPTTIMNTDTANFRALVQQFTGGAAPTAPFAPTPAPGVLNFGFGLGTASGNVNPNGAMMAPSGSFHLVQPSQQQQRFHQDQLRHILGVDPRLGVNYLRGTNYMEGSHSQAHPGPSSSSDDVNNNNSTYNMF